jgi:type VI secretion system protein ImpG
MHLLYELLFSKLTAVRVSNGTEAPEHTVILPQSAVLPVGFEANESMLESDPRSFQGYRLLSEYFAFPDKFMFFELTGLNDPRLWHKGNKLRIQFLLSSFADTERHARLLKSLSAQNFKLGCVPVVNLFQQTADPIRVTHTKSSYPIVVDGRKPGAYEVYSIDSVKRIEKNGSQEECQTVPPFYSINHFTGEGQHPFHWHSTRESSPRKNDKGTDVEISLVDLDFRPVRPDAEVLSLELTCTNRNVPDAIPFGGSSRTQEGFTVPNHSVIKQAWPLRKPTSSLRPPSKRGLQWRLISHISLNQLSMAAHGKEAIQEVLGLYNYTDSPAVAKQIQGIVDVSSRAVTARIPGKEFAAFARGMEIRMVFDESYYIGSNLYLFASILERFYGHFCAPNSFVQFCIHTKQQEGEVARWPSRAGEMAMI